MYVLCVGLFLKCFVVVVDVEPPLLLLLILTKLMKMN